MWSACTSEHGRPSVRNRNPVSYWLLSTTVTTSNELLCDAIAHRCNGRIVLLQRLGRVVPFGLVQSVFNRGAVNDVQPLAFYFRDELVPIGLVQLAIEALFALRVLVALLEPGHGFDGFDQCFFVLVGRRLVAAFFDRLFDDVKGFPASEHV